MADQIKAEFEVATILVSPDEEYGGHLVGIANKGNTSGDAAVVWMNPEFLYALAAEYGKGRKA